MHPLVKFLDGPELDAGLQGGRPHGQVPVGHHPTADDLFQGAVYWQLEGTHEPIVQLPDVVQGRQTRAETIKSQRFYREPSFAMILLSNLELFNLEFCEILKYDSLGKLDLLVEDCTLNYNKCNSIKL